MRGFNNEIKKLQFAFCLIGCSLCHIVDAQPFGLRARNSNGTDTPTKLDDQSGLNTEEQMGIGIAGTVGSGLILTGLYNFSNYIYRAHQLRAIRAAFPFKADLIDYLGLAAHEYANMDNDDNPGGVFNQFIDEILYQFTWGPTGENLYRAIAVGRFSEEERGRLLSTLQQAILSNPQFHYSSRMNLTYWCFGRILPIQLMQDEHFKNEVLQLWENDLRINHYDIYRYFQKTSELDAMLQEDQRGQEMRLEVNIKRERIQQKAETHDIESAQYVFQKLKDEFPMTEDDRLVDQANEWGETPLYKAVMMGEPRICRWLLDSAPPNRKKELIAQANFQGQTCLHAASMGKHHQILRFLLDSLSGEDQKDLIMRADHDGRTLLHYTQSLRTCAEVAGRLTQEELISLIMRKTQDGSTVLHGPCMLGSPDLCEWFLQPLSEHQKDQLLNPTEGPRILWSLVPMEQVEMCNLLIDYGAKIDDISRMIMQDTNLYMTMDGYVARTEQERRNAAHGGITVIPRASISTPSLGMITAQSEMAHLPSETRNGQQDVPASGGGAAPEANSPE